MFKSGENHQENVHMKKKIQPQRNKDNLGHFQVLVSVAQRQSVGLGSRGPGFETRPLPSGFPLGKKISRHCQVAQFAGNAHWAEPSPLFAHRARPTSLKSKNEYLVLPLGEETAVQAVVGFIVWAFRRLKKPRRREMSAPNFPSFREKMNGIRRN